MKYILALYLLLIATFGYSQNFNGDYRSNSTSFKSEIDSTENFREETLFNVAVLIDDIKDGMIAIQDPRIPEKLLIYKIESYTGKLKNNGYDMHIYKAITEHLTTPKKITIVLYHDLDKNFNIMISSSESSQTFYGLEIQ